MFETSFYSEVKLVVKNVPANAGDIRDSGLVPGLGRCPGGGHGNPLQYSCLENPMDRGFWWTEDSGGLQSLGSQSRTRLKQLSTHTRCYTSCNYVCFSLRSSLCLIPRIQSQQCIFMQMNICGSIIRTNQVVFISISLGSAYI